MSYIEVNNLSFKYENKEKYLLNNINFKLNKGEIVCITGPSGCGKSTFCQILCGIIPKIYSGYLKGEVIISGININQLAFGEISTNIGAIFQDPDVQIFMPTIIDEIAFGLENFCFPRDEIIKKVESILDYFNLYSRKIDNPKNLSGGQKQMIVLASVLIMEQNVLILDEAFSHVDYTNREKIYEKLIELKKGGKSILIVSHDTDCNKIADRLFKFDKGKLLEM